MTEIQASDALVELAFAALDHGIESVRAAPGRSSRSPSPKGRRAGS
jgi:hypothetical protein